MCTQSKRAIIGAALVVAVIVLQIRLSAYTFTTFDYPGATSTRLYGINNKGHVVGIANGFGFGFDGGFAQNGFGFVWRNGKFKRLQSPDGRDLYPFGINDNGWIVGSVGRSGFLLKPNGEFSCIDFPFDNQYPSPSTAALGISSRGDIVGRYVASPSETWGFLLRNGTYTQFQFPDPHRPGSLIDETHPWAINSARQITGFVENQGVGYNFGFIYAGGVFTAIKNPRPECGPGTTCDLWVYGIDDALRFVGEYAQGGTDAQNEAFVLAGGTFTSIHVPGAAYTKVRKSNTAGTIVGWYEDANGAIHGYIITGLCCW